MTDEKNFTMLFPANIMPLWPQIAPLLQPSVDRAGTHDVEDVRKSLLNGSLHLWIQYRLVGRAVIDAVAITEMVPYPRELRLRVWLAGANNDGEADWLRVASQIKEFAKANKCGSLEVVGRKGWNRLFPEAEEKSRTYRMSING